MYANAVPIIFSTTADVTINGTTFHRGDLVRVDDPGDPEHTASLYLSVFGSERDLDAVYVRTDGKIIVSFDGSNPYTLGGLTFRYGDLALYDSTNHTASLYLKGNINTAGTDSFGNTDSIFRIGSGTVTSENIDAFDILPNGHLLISTHGTNSWLDKAGGGVLEFANEDLVEYDPIAKVATGIWFKGDDYFDTEENLKAIGLLSTTQILLTTELSVTIGGVTYQKNDIIQMDLDTGSASLFMDHTKLPSGTYGINAIHVIPEPATIGLLGLGILGLLRKR